MKKIEFIYLNEYSYEVCERPQPSKVFLPDWFRQIEPYNKSPENPSGTRLMMRDGQTNATAKKCTPMLDVMISGYTVPLWADVHVSQEYHEPYLGWRVKQNVFEKHGLSSERVPAPVGYKQYVFKYLTWFRIKTPPGYSTLVMPLPHHQNMPFHPIPAIVDTDKSVVDSNFPMWVKEDFEGIVEKGTPMVQLIPFKRDDWKAEFSWITQDQRIIEEDIGFYSTIQNNYLKNIWSKKRFS